MKRLYENYLIGYVLGIVLFFGVWELASWAVSTFAAKPLQWAVPPPARALNIFVEEWRSLVPHFFASGYRVLSGLLLAIVIAMPLGLVIGHERVLDRLLSPFDLSDVSHPQDRLSPVALRLSGDLRCPQDRADYACVSLSALALDSRRCQEHPQELHSLRSERGSEQVARLQARHPAGEPPRDVLRAANLYWHGDHGVGTD
jgi:hypothetical protein